MDAVNIVAAIVVLIGWAGTVVPVLPGLVLIFTAALVHALVTGFRAIDSGLLWTLGLLTGGAEAVGYWATAAGAKRYGASKAGLTGAVVGTVLGLFMLGPIGILVGPLLGAVVGELITGRRAHEVIRAGIGAVLGTLGGTFIQFIVGGVMVFLVFKALFF